MSSSKKTIPEDPPMFDRDPVTGKLIPLPLNWGSDQNVTSKNRQRAMDFKDLKPLRLTPADFEEPVAQPAKKIKLEVRRGLFNFPSTSKGVPTFVTKETSRSRNIPSRKVRKELFTFSATTNVIQTATTNQLSVGSSEVPNKEKSHFESPLLDIDEVEELPLSLTDTMNFVKLEEMLKNEENEKIAESSPVTSVCNLLKMTNINTCKIQDSYSKKKDTAKLIQDAICAEEKCFKDFEEIYQNNLRRMELAFNEYKSKHEKNMEMLNSKLKSLATPLKNKENDPNRIGRRSVRLQQKSPLYGFNKLLVSPVPTKSENLLKSTLKKNAAARYQNDSPRTREALLMYNSLRNNNGGILETPRMDRKALLKTPKSAEKRSLSWKVQRQCLLLQDSPIPK